MSYLGIPKPVVMGASLMMAALVSTGSPSAAQTVEEFYSKNDITLQVNAAAGGSADFFARAIAPYLTKYIPGNPDIIVQNKPGAGGLVGAVELQHNAPKDGTFISSLLRNNYVDPLLKENTNFDPREVSSLGSIAKNLSVCYTVGEKPVSLADAQKQEVIMTGTGAGSGTVVMPRVLNELAGAKFKIVGGYKGTDEELLAVERGEAEGRCPGYTTTKRGVQKQWFDAGKLHYMVVFSRTRLADLPDVPTAFEFISDPEAQKILRFITAVDDIGRPFAAPGGLPKDRLAALREAFAKVAADPDFVAELAKLGDDVDFVPGEEVQAVANELMSTSKDFIAKVEKVRSGK